MHYDIEVDLAAENTSHAQVVDLVGTGKDVLDVGCSTGYLAKVLTERGCRVSGVELDPEAAEAARAHCEAVLVADLDRDDLAALAFEHPFDVIVFADILEHLRDPVRTLRASASLLRPGGYVVVSIPNVGHGSVRLALAAGRFDYRDAGLLDRTHLRFFTRETLADLLSTAGFSLQELRRTTAGVLETEIPVDPSAVPAGLLAEVEQDPEARTYQFVLTAVPLDAGSGGAAAALARKDREIDALRSQFAEVLRALGPGPSAPAVTVLVASPRGMWRIRSEVVAAELAGRLDGFRVEVLESADLDRLRSGTARPVAVVPVGAVDGPLAAALDHLAGGATVVLPEPGGGGWPGPDVAMLTPSLYDGALVEQRVRFLRLVGVLPSAGELLVASAGLFAAGPDGVRALAATLDLHLIVSDAPADSAEWEVGSSDPLDLAAAVSAATVVLSDEPGLISLAVAYGRPALTVAGPETFPPPWLEAAGLVVRRLADVPAAVAPARARVGDPAWIEELTESLASLLDDVAGAVVGSAARGQPRATAQRVVELADRLRVLGEANAALRRRLRTERIAFGARAGALMQAPPAPGERAAGPVEPSSTVERLRADNARLVAEAEAARAELQALLRTKTLRVLQPARSVYGRLRSLAP